MGERESVGFDFARSLAAGVGAAGGSAAQVEKQERASRRGPGRTFGGLSVQAKTDGYGKVWWEQSVAGLSWEGGEQNVRVCRAKARH